MSKRILPCLLFFALAGGCSHGGDGTVIIPKPLDLRRVWDKGGGVSPEPRSSEPGAFPVAPDTRVKRARITATAGPGRHRARPVSGQSATPAGSAGDGLACHNVSGPGERVRVVCE